MGGGSLLQRINGQERILGKDEVRAGKRLTLSSRTSDRRHWCEVCPAGAIRFPRPALARALPARSCQAVFVCISFPLREIGNVLIFFCGASFRCIPVRCAGSSFQCCIFLSSPARLLYQYDYQQAHPGSLLRISEDLPRDKNTNDCTP